MRYQCKRCGMIHRDPRPSYCDCGNNLDRPKGYTQLTEMQAIASESVSVPTTEWADSSLLPPRSRWPEQLLRVLGWIFLGVFWFMAAALKGMLAGAAKKSRLPHSRSSRGGDGGCGGGDGGGDGE